MGRQNIIPEHEQEEMGFVLDPPALPREKWRGNEQQDEGQRKRKSSVLSSLNW